eukprot:5476467-Amphidinium_carterae.1
MAHPGGCRQVLQGQALAQKVSEVYRFMAKQGAALAVGDASDHAELKCHTEGCVRIKRGRGSRKHWEAPAWLAELADLAPRAEVPEAEVLQVGVQTRSPPLRRFAERGEGHAWGLFTVRDAEGSDKGRLLSCS